MAGAKNILTKLSFAWLGLILVQIGLGAATVWTNKSADIATAHVAVAALSLMVGAMTTLIAFRCVVVGPKRVVRAQAERGVGLPTSGAIAGSARQMT